MPCCILKTWPPSDPPRWYLPSSAHDPVHHAHTHTHTHTSTQMRRACTRTTNQARIKCRTMICPSPSCAQKLYHFHQEVAESALRFLLLLLLLLFLLVRQHLPDSLPPRPGGDSLAALPVHRHRHTVGDRHTDTHTVGDTDTHRQTREG